MVKGLGTLFDQGAKTIRWENIFQQIGLGKLDIHM